MTNSLPPLGYTAVLQNFDPVMAQIRQLQNQAASLGKQQVASQGITNGLAAMGQGAQQAGNLFDWLTVRSVAMGIGVYNAVSNAARSLVDFAKQGVFAAARAEQMNLMLYQMGANLGITTAEIDKSTSALKKMNFTTEVAQNATLQFMRYNIDLAQTQTLAREAQDAATVANIDSSEALDRMIMGIVTGQTEMLRTMQINVNFEQSYKTMAASLNKHVDLLTEQERIQARVNAVIAEAPGLMGLYEISMESAGKRLNSIMGRVIPEIALQIGNYFLPAFGTAVRTLDDFTKSILTAVGEGGRLEPLLLRLGAGASLAADGLRSAASSLTDGLLNAISDASTSIDDVIFNALEWGFNLIASFASGVAEGASTVLVDAMNIVAGVISFFLQANSPPRVAPDITKWGLEAMRAWLAGFTDVDYSVFDTVTSSIQKVFAALGSIGLMDHQAAELAELQRGMAEFLRTGQGAEEIAARAGAAVAVFGADVAKLVRSQLDLAAATQRVTAAQEALDAARTAEQDANKKMIGQVSEYNKMVRAGASKEQLKTKLAEVRAAEQAAKLAADARKGAEGELTAAEKQALAIQKQVDAQQKLVDSLLEYAKLMHDALEVKPPLRSPSGGDAKKPGVPPPIKPPTPVKIPLKIETSELTKKIEALKADLKARLEKAFQPVMDAWNNSIKGNLDKIGVAFSNLLTQLQGLLASPAGQFLQRMLGISAEQNPGASPLERAAEGLGRLLGGFLALRVVGMILSPIIGFFGLLGKVPGVSLLAGKAITGIVSALGNIGPVGWIAAAAIAAIAAGLVLLYKDNPAFKAGVDDAVEHLKAAWVEGKRQVGVAVDGIIAKWKEFRDSPYMLQGVHQWEDFFAGLKTKIAEVGPALREVVDNAKGVLADFKKAWDDITVAVGNISTKFGIVVAEIINQSPALQGAIATIKGWWSDLTTAIGGWWDGIIGKIEDAINRWKVFYGFKQPSGAPDERGGAPAPAPTPAPVKPLHPVDPSKPVVPAPKAPVTPVPKVPVTPVPKVPVAPKPIVPNPGMPGLTLPVPGVPKATAPAIAGVALPAIKATPAEIGAQKAMADATAALITKLQALSTLINGAVKTALLFLHTETIALTGFIGLQTVSVASNMLSWTLLATVINTVVQVALLLLQVGITSVDTAVKALTVDVGLSLVSWTNLTTVMDGMVVPKTGILDRMLVGLGYVSGAIKTLSKLLDDLKDDIEAIRIPDWWYGHSPPPLANWTNDINAAVSQLARTELPALKTALNDSALRSSLEWMGKTQLGVSVEQGQPNDEPPVTTQAIQRAQIAAVTAQTAANSEDAQAIVAAIKTLDASNTAGSERLITVSTGTNTALAGINTLLTGISDAVKQIVDLVKLAPAPAASGGGGGGGGAPTPAPKSTVGPPPQPKYSPLPKPGEGTGIPIGPPPQPKWTPLPGPQPPQYPPQPKWTPLPGPQPPQPQPPPKYNPLASLVAVGASLAASVGTLIADSLSSAGARAAAAGALTTRLQVRAQAPRVQAQSLLAQGGAQGAAAPQFVFNTTVSSGLSQAQFEARVRRVVRDSLR